MKAIFVTVLLASLIAMIACGDDCIDRQIRIRLNELSGNCNIDTLDMDVSFFSIILWQLTIVLSLQASTICNMPDCVRTFRSIYDACGRTDPLDTGKTNVNAAIAFYLQQNYSFLLTVCNGSVRVYALPMLMVSMLVAALSMMF